MRFWNAVLAGIAVIWGQVVAADMRGTDAFGTPILLRDDRTWAYLDELDEISLGAEELGMVDVDVYEDPYRNWNRANWGAHGRLSLSANVNGNTQSRRRIFMRFDTDAIADLYSPDARVILELQGERRQGPRNAGALVYRVVAPWSEGRGRYNPGQVEPDAWRGEISWMTQPRIGTRRSWGRMSLEPRRGPYRVDITDLVQAWMNDRFFNDGLVLILDDEDYSSYSYLFHSTESEQSDLRPHLVILRGDDQPINPPEPDPRPSQPNLLVNGGFEEARPGRSRKHQIAGWKIRRGQIDVEADYWQAGEGRISIDLAGSPGLGQIMQIVRTDAGAEYELTFLLAGNPECDDPKKELLVLSGPVETSFSFDTRGRSREDMGWRRESILFTARDSKSPITFAARGNNKRCGPALDAIWLQKVED